MAEEIRVKDLVWIEPPSSVGRSADFLAGLATGAGDTTSAMTPFAPAIGTHFFQHEAFASRFASAGTLGAAQNSLNGLRQLMQAYSVRLPDLDELAKWLERWDDAYADEVTEALREYGEFSDEPQSAEPARRTKRRPPPIRGSPRRIGNRRTSPVRAENRLAPSARAGNLCPGAPSSRAGPIPSARSRAYPPAPRPRGQTPANAAS